MTGPARRRARREPAVGTERRPRVIVRDVMTSPAVTAVPETTLGEIADLMLSHQIGCVVVVDPTDEGVPVGIVTTTDLTPREERVPRAQPPAKAARLLSGWVESAAHFEQAYATWRSLPVAEVMSTPVRTIEAGRHVWEAARALLEHGIERLPVLEGGRLVGIVAERDLLRCLAVQEAPPKAAIPDTGAAREDVALRRAVCGVDGSPEALEAVRQAAGILAPGGDLVLVAAVDPWSAVLYQAGRDAEEVMEGLRAAARASLAAARDAAGAAGPEVHSRLLEERAPEALVGEALARGADLIAVGSHGTGRLRGILLGSTATIVLHRAPCSVLVARQPEGGPETPFPSRIVVGLDGSPEAGHALAVARAIGDRAAASVRTVVGTGGALLDLAPVRRLDPAVTVSRQAAIPALLAAARRADLLVVGSRGLGGARALGSVSERLAHRARCSVLVVRRPPA